MATITRQNIAPQIDKLIVKIQKDDYLPAFEKSLKHYAKTANMQGFRKGMMPTGLVKKMYGGAIFDEQIIKLVDEELNKYLQDNRSEILMQPLPIDDKKVSLDVNDPQDYEFEFEIAIQPKVEIDVKNINVKRYKVEITDEMVEDEIDRELLRNGDFQTPETIAADVPDTVINVDMEAGEKKGHTSFSLKDVAQAQQEEFAGKKIGDVITVQINKAFEDETIQKRILGDLGLSDEEKANATEMEIMMHITKISLLLKAELNEELFKKIYPTKEIKTEAEFREAMKEDVTEYYNRQANEQVGDQIYHYLTEQVKLDFPETFLKRWLVVNSEGKKTPEDAEKEYPDFVKNVQWAFLSNKLCNDYNIDVKASDISDFFRNQLMRYIGGQIDVTKDNSWLDEYVNSSMSDKKQVEEAYVQLRISGLLSTLATQVNATDTPISEHDFTELLHEHHHH